ncbi:MAG: RNA 2',3'-cyclic phosphodiesterase [Candidatus Atribacteria bacterium]|nr:RNA 2',3'-cyclic phosphodiesterase [Candidatus Atribacteria bacterium]
METKDTKRVFIAIHLDQEIIKYLHSVQEEIISCIERNREIKIKFVEMNNLHISLKFLDELKPLEIEKTMAILQKNTVKYQPFEIHLLKSIGIFPNDRKPRVLWIGINEGSQMIQTIYDAIEKDIVKEIFHRKDNHFAAHITLGRVRCFKNPDKIIECRNQVSYKNISQVVNSIELMESKLTSQGPIYRVIKRFPLAH